ncbi:MAG: type II toxin-antitoxin system RelE/ParE family toxin [Candidatus Omnitrophica bacterium]|nr:type II toxin-antitoxin system RelE/ParE family toxin [Candidatus Omnitrophota bacterium]
MASLHKTRGAILDLLENADYIAEDSIQAAHRFLESAEKSFQLLQENPRIGKLLEIQPPRRKNFRVWHVSGFPKYMIFYRFEGDRIEVDRIIHASRDLPSILEDL